MGRTTCCDKNGLKKGPWTHEEDLKLTQYIQLHGAGNWRTLPKNAGLQRCGKSCRLRWTNYLRPDIKRGRFSFEEEETIIQLHRVLGNKWSAIAARLPGRTDNEIKNYWNTHIRKRLLRMGIDPVTHTPRLDLLDLPALLNSAQFNLSNFLGLQTLVNPGTLKLLSALVASNTQNPEILLPKFQENQLLNAQFQNQTAPLVQENPFQDIPISTTPDASCSSYLNQNPDMYGILEQFLMNSSNIGEQKMQDNMMPSDASFLCEQNNSYPVLDQISTDLSENDSSALHLNEYSNPSSQNIGFDSVFSTPLSGSPLTSSSTFINSITEDEKESYCSDFMKFEIPESLDFDDFM